jgi:hypothetical protein
MLSLQPTLDFPHFTPDNHRITSPKTPEYNCIGWAAGETDRFWWPAHHPDAYWPPNIPRTPTVDAFIAAFATKGYAVCENGNLEVGYEKVVLYVNQDGPTHMARQLPDGKWTSKLGRSFDIEHSDPSVVNGSAYGWVSTYLRRKIVENLSVSIESSV